MKVELIGDTPVHMHMYACMCALSESIPEAENITNAELGKISAWARENKLQFSKQKSQVMLLTRRRRKENKEIKIYLNNRPLIQVNSMRYLDIIFDHKQTLKNT